MTTTLMTTRNGEPVSCVISEIWFSAFVKDGQTLEKTGLRNILPDPSNESRRYSAMQCTVEYDGETGRE